MLTLHFVWKLSAVGIQGVEAVLCVRPRIHIHDLDYMYFNPTQCFQQCHIKVASLQ